MRYLACSYYTVAGVSPTAGLASPLSFETRARACAEAGYKGVGVHMRDYLALRRGGTTDIQLAAVLRENGLRCTEVEFLLNWFADGELGEIARRDEEVLYQAAEALGAPVMNLTGDLQPGNPMPPEQMAEKFAGLCARAAQRGVTIGVEPVAWSNIGDVDDALRLIDAAGVANAGLVLDVWHLYRRGFDYERLRAVPPERIVGVQLDDAQEEVRGGGLPADSIDHRALPGEGAARAADFVRVLDEIGTTCPLSVEVLSVEQRARPLHEAAEASYRAARRVVDEAAVR